jgi:enoyl-[acyl-carrier protein] reductase I
VSSNVSIDLSGKAGLVLGVANRRSIAWAIAQALDRAGATLAIAYQNERVKPYVEELAATLGKPLLLPCDVTAERQIQALFSQIEQQFGGLDLLVHSIAYAPASELERELSATSREGFRETLEVSAYSLISLARQAAPLMEERGGGSIIALTFQAAKRVFPGYNVMGPAKAALEGIIRQLAYELGPRNIRVNGLSPGPLRTLAARGVPRFTEMLKLHGERAPLRRNITHQEVAKAALFLMSDLATAITGEILHVDAGYHVMGI